ncbi:hypothetical protein BH18ACT11_BH18ACT11_14030 [soil metagenome]
MTENKGANAASHPQQLGVMEGKGFYNRHSRPQHSAVAFGLPLLERAVEAVPLPDQGDVFRVADYGVAGGHNSMEPVRTVIDVVRRRASADLAVSPSFTPIWRPTISILCSCCCPPPTAICREPPTSSLVKEAFANQSEQDWRSFLDHRGHELSPGGRLVVLGGASDAHGNSGAEGLLDMANAALKGMVD